jgi:hypothetical protein
LPPGKFRRQLRLSKFNQYFREAFDQVLEVLGYPIETDGKIVW